MTGIDPAIDRYFSYRLAQRILDYPSGSLPPHVAAKTHDCVIDAIGCALAGVTSQAAIAARHAATKTFGKGTAPAWFTPVRLSHAGAAWCNAMAASALDFDDGHRLARGHPGSAIVPAVLAIAEKKRASMCEVLTSIAVGYEVAIACAAAQKQDKVQTYQSGRWVGLGVVAACGRLVGLDPGQMANALAIAGVWAPNQQANGSSGYAVETGNWAKEGIPTAVLQAMMAVELAGSGFTGPIDFLDHKSHFEFAPEFLDGFNPRLIADTYFKRYSCCRYIHPALDAYLSLAMAENFKPDHIAKIEVRTFAQALRLGNVISPKTLTEAQYSLPFCLSALVHLGENALMPLGDDVLRDPKVSDFARRIELICCDRLNRSFPRQTLSTVRVILKSGQAVETPKPVAPLPLASSDIRRKLEQIGQKTGLRDSSADLHHIFEVCDEGLQALKRFVSSVGALQ